MGKCSYPSCKKDQWGQSDRCHMHSGAQQQWLDNILSSPGTSVCETVKKSKKKTSKKLKAKPKIGTVPKGAARLNPATNSTAFPLVPPMFGAPEWGFMGSPGGGGALLGLVPPVSVEQLSSQFHPAFTPSIVAGLQGVHPLLNSGQQVLPGAGFYPDNASHLLASMVHRQSFPDIVPGHAGSSVPSQTLGSGREPDDSDLSVFQLSCHQKQRRASCSPQQTPHDSKPSTYHSSVSQLARSWHSPHVATSPYDPLAKQQTGSEAEDSQDCSALDLSMEQKEHAEQCPGTVFQQAEVNIPQADDEATDLFIQRPQNTKTDKQPVVQQQQPSSAQDLDGQANSRQSDINEEDVMIVGEEDDVLFMGVERGKEKAGRHIGEPGGNRPRNRQSSKQQSKSTATAASHSSKLQSESTAIPVADESGDTDDEDCIVLDLTMDMASEMQTTVSTEQLPPTEAERDGGLQLRADCDTLQPPSYTDQAKGMTSHSESEPSEIMVLETVSLSKETNTNFCEDSVTKTYRQLSAESYYRCGCLKGRCGFRTVLRTQLELHLREVHPYDVIYPCVHCGSQEAGLDSLMSHLEQHLTPEAESFYCSNVSCHFKSFAPEEVLKHMREHHPQHDCHVCWRCNARYDSLTKFSLHVKQNLLFIFRCQHCSAKDVDQRAVLMHMDSSHPDQGRSAVVQKVLVCKERKMNSWGAPDRVNVETPTFERTEPQMPAYNSEQVRSLETRAKGGLGSLMARRGKVPDRRIGIISPMTHRKADTPPASQNKLSDKEQPGVIADQQGQPMVGGVQDGETVITATSPRALCTRKATDKSPNKTTRKPTVKTPDKTIHETTNKSPGKKSTTARTKKKANRCTSAASIEEGCSKGSNNADNSEMTVRVDDTSAADLRQMAGRVEDSSMEPELAGQCMDGQDEAEKGDHGKGESKGKESVEQTHRSGGGDEDGDDEEEKMSDTDAPASCETKTPASWVERTYQHTEGGRRDSNLPVKCLICNQDSSSMDFHIKHIHTHHRTLFKGFACKRCSFISIDEDGGNGHRCAGSHELRARSRIVYDEDDTVVWRVAYSLEDTNSTPASPTMTETRNLETDDEPMTRSVRKRRGSSLSTSPKKATVSPETSLSSSPKKANMSPVCSSSPKKAKVSPGSTPKRPKVSPVSSLSLSPNAHMYQQQRELKCPKCSSQPVSGEAMFRHLCDEHTREEVLLHSQCQFVNRVSVSSEENPSHTALSFVNTQTAEAVEQEAGPSHLPRNIKKCATQKLNTNKDKYSNRITECRLCSFRAESKADMLTHLFKTHKEVQCTACSAIVYCVQGLHSHIAKQHPEEKAALRQKTNPYNWFHIIPHSKSSPWRQTKRKLGVDTAKWVSQSDVASPLLLKIQKQVQTLGTAAESTEVQQIMSPPATDVGPLSQPLEGLVLPDRREANLFNPVAEMTSNLAQQMQLTFSNTCAGMSSVIPILNNEQSELLIAMEVRDDMEYRCPHCTSDFKLRYKFYEHLCYHYHYRCFKCAHCPFLAFSGSSIVNHCRRTHDEEPRVRHLVKQNFERRIEKVIANSWVNVKDPYTERRLKAYERVKLRKIVKDQEKREMRLQKQNCNSLEKNKVHINKAESPVKKKKQVHLKPKVSCRRVPWQGKAASTAQASATSTSSDPEKKKWLICPYCRGPKKTQTAVEREIRFHVHYKPYHCPYCKFTSSSEKFTKKHVSCTHPGNEVKVNYERCERKEARFEELLRRAFELSQSVVKAEVTGHVKRKYRKRAEAGIVGSAEGMTQHMKTQHKKKIGPAPSPTSNILCAHCPFSSSDRDAVTAHILVNHQDLLKNEYTALPPPEASTSTDPPPSHLPPPTGNALFDWFVGKNHSEMAQLEDSEDSVTTIYDLGGAGSSLEIPGSNIPTAEVSRDLAAVSDEVDGAVPTPGSCGDVLPTSEIDSDITTEKSASSHVAADFEEAEDSDSTIENTIEVWPQVSSRSQSQNHDGGIVAQENPKEVSPPSQNHDGSAPARENLGEVPPSAEIPEGCAAAVIKSDTALSPCSMKATENVSVRGNGSSTSSQLVNPADSTPSSGEGNVTMSSAVSCEGTDGAASVTERPQDTSLSVGGKDDSARAVRK